MSGAMVLIASDTLGRGDEELGRRLMVKFFHQLCSVAERPPVVAFLNSGVKLLTRSSPVLDALRALDEAGVDLLACGTCVEHFNLRDDIGVGRISDMREIVTTMAKAERVISL